MSQEIIDGVYWEYNPLILAFDPNFQRDIQVQSPLPAFCFEVETFLTKRGPNKKNR